MEPLRRAGRGVRRLGKRRLRFRFAFRFRATGLPRGAMERCWVEVRRGDKVARTAEAPVAHAEDAADESAAESGGQGDADTPERNGDLGGAGGDEVSWEATPLAAEFTMYQSMLGGGAGGSAGGWVPVGAGGRLERKGARLAVLGRDALLRTVHVGAATVDLARFARVEADTQTFHLAVPMDGVDPARLMGSVLHVQVECTCLSFAPPGTGASAFAAYDAGSETSGAGSFVSELDDPREPLVDAGGPSDPGRGVVAPERSDAANSRAARDRYRPPPMREAKGQGASPPVGGGWGGEGRPPLPPPQTTVAGVAAGAATVTAAAVAAAGVPGAESGGLRRRPSRSPSPTAHRNIERRMEGAAAEASAQGAEGRQAPAGEGGRGPLRPGALVRARRRFGAAQRTVRKCMDMFTWVDILEVGVHFTVTFVACLLAICIAVGYIP